MKTPKILVPALRQYQHNDCSGFVPGFDYDETIKILEKYREEIKMTGIEFTAKSESGWRTSISISGDGRIAMEDGSGRVTLSIKDVRKIVREYNKLISGQPAMDKT